MKILFVTVLLAVLLFSLIMFIDVVMGITNHGLLWKALNPLKVMEPAEYFIIAVLLFFSLLAFIKDYLKKKLPSQ